jgi:hypothetical protein
MSRRASVPRFLRRRSIVLRALVRRASIPKLSEVGFHGDASLTASSQLNSALAAMIAVGTLSLCAGVTLAVLSIRASMALPLPS